MTPSEDLKNLVDSGGFRLEEVRFRELGACRRDDPSSEGSLTPEFSLGVGRERDDCSRFGISLRCEIPVTNASWIVCEAEALYEVLEDFHIPVTRQLILEYANEVAVMALIPYVRQGIADMSQRVFGAPVLMPVMKRGDIHFGDGEQESLAE